MLLTGAVSVTASFFTTAAAAAAGLLQATAFSQVRTALAALTASSTSWTVAAAASNQQHSSSSSSSSRSSSSALLPPPYRICSTSSSLQHATLSCEGPGQHLLAGAGVHSGIKVQSVSMMNSAGGIPGSSSSSRPFSSSTAATGGRSTKHPDSGGELDGPAPHKQPRKRGKAATATATAPAPVAAAAATPSESAADALCTQLLHKPLHEALHESLHAQQQPVSAHSLIRNPRKALSQMTQPPGGPRDPAVSSSAAATAAGDALQPSSTKSPQQPGRAEQLGLLQLTGTEQQLFAQALNYMPPQATAELVEVAEVS
jgi:hypothetical protein